MPVVRIRSEGHPGDDGDEDADADHELIQRTQRASELFGGHLGDVHWHKVGRRADTPAGEQTADEHEPHVRRRAAENAAEDERNRRANQSRPPPDAVGDTTAVRRTHRGADKHGRNHEAFQLRVEGDTEVPREVVQRGVDDAEVVAEGERAEARDEHARQNPHEQLAALQGLKLGFGLTSLEVGGG